MYLKNKQDLKEMWPFISEMLANGGDFSLLPNGTSMLPLIRPGEDLVTIVAPKELKKDDIVLFVRKTGQFVLHRIVSMKNGLCNMIGDNQKTIEFKIPVEDIVAKVKYIHRNGEVIDFESKDYKKYVKKIRRKTNFYRFPSFLSIMKQKIFKKKSTSK